MPLAGKKLTVGLALALCHKVGFRKHALTVAVALMTAESGRYVEAWHDNIVEGMDPPGGTVLSTDRGLFQINDKWHPDLSDADAYCAIPNAAYAYSLTQGKNFSAWAAYNSKRYLLFMPEVVLVKVLGRWKNKIQYVEERLVCSRTA